MVTPEQIRATRQTLAMTQEEFAVHLGCSAQAVSFWERGTRTPRGLYARELARIVAETDDLMASLPHSFAGYTAPSRLAPA